MLHFVTRPDLTPPALTVNTEGPYFAVTADDASGHVLAQSATVSLEK